MAIVKKGDRISLARNVFFFMDEVGINLKKGVEDTTTVPNDINDKALGIIEQSILIGDIKLGWPEEKLQPIPDDKNIGDILEKGRNKVNDFLYELSQNKSVKDQDKITKFEKLLGLEKKGKNRSTVTKTIEKYLSEVAGVSPVVEDEEEKVEINLVKGTKEKDKTE